MVTHQLSQSSLDPQTIRKERIIDFISIIDPESFTLLWPTWRCNQRQSPQEGDIILAECWCPKLLDNDNLRWQNFFELEILRRYERLELRPIRQRHARGFRCRYYFSAFTPLAGDSFTPLCTHKARRRLAKTALGLKNVAADAIWVSTLPRVKAGVGRSCLRWFVVVSDVRVKGQLGGLDVFCS